MAILKLGCPWVILLMSANFVSLGDTAHPKIIGLSSNAVDNEADVGTDVTFKCVVENSSTSTITWSSTIYTDMGTGPEWTLGNTTCEDTTTYFCTVVNDIGQSEMKAIPLYIRCPPKIGQTLKRTTEARIGDEVSLKIYIQAYPAPRFTWKKVETNKEFQIAKTEKIVENYFKSTLDLTVNNSTFGYYLIMVNNGFNGICNVETWTVNIVNKDWIAMKPKPPATKMSEMEAKVQYMKSSTQRNIAEVEILKLKKIKLELEIEKLKMNY